MNVIYSINEQTGVTGPWLMSPLSRPLPVHTWLTYHPNQSTLLMKEK